MADKSQRSERALRRAQRRRNQRVVLGIILLVIVVAAVYLVLSINGFGGDSTFVTENGVRVEILEEGTGEELGAGDTISVHYVLRLADGGSTPIDASADRGIPLVFTIADGEVIPGWDEGMVGIKIGEKRNLVIPPALGYGAQGAGGGLIPPNATLLFEVEALGVHEVEIDEVAEGDGQEVVKGDVITVHYVGTLEDGTVFDSSRDRDQPFTTQIGTRSVIKGWDLGMVGMKVGGTRILTIPSELGYGPEDNPPIPGGSTLIFEVELLSIGTNQ